MHDTNSLCTFTKIEQLKIFDGSQNPDFQVSGSLARTALGAAGTREDGNIQGEGSSTLTMQMHSGCKMIVFCSNFWICHNCYIDLFKFNMDLSRLINGFL